VSLHAFRSADVRHRRCDTPTLVLLTRTTAGPITARLAVTPDDLDDAARLVHEVYVARGLRDATARGGVNTERSAVFIARIEGAAGATVSLVSDGPRGLPADALYAPELRALRGRRRTLAEVSGLAVAPSCRGNALALVRPLVQLVGIYARDIERVDDLCIAVHPRHAPFYARAFGFTRFGAEKPYHAVKDAPAVGLRLDLHRPPVAGGLSAVLFESDEIARVRAALATARRMQILQFRPPSRSLQAFHATEVC